ncbi:MAG: transcriptional regulator, TetR family [Chloroflexi bacterium]|nr:transcriptional regulator, TetR family [Chloroflexota bacterium]
MTPKERTQERILRAFIDLVVEHGYEGTTTRAVAEQAGVNEVTLFRHFGDKETLAREAFRRLGPGPALASYEPHIDASDPALAEAGLRACLVFLRDTMRDHPMMLNPALREVFRHVGKIGDANGIPNIALALLRRALAQAAPALRPEVDQEATAFSLLGLIMVSLMWKRFGWLSFSTNEGDDLLAGALLPLICWTRDLEHA